MLLTVSSICCLSALSEHHSRYSSALPPGGWHPSVWGNAEMAKSSFDAILYWNLSAGTAFSLICHRSCLSPSWCCELASALESWCKVSIASSCGMFFHWTHLAGSWWRAMSWSFLPNNGWVHLTQVCLTAVQQHLQFWIMYSMLWQWSPKHWIEHCWADLLSIF